MIMPTPKGCGGYVARVLVAVLIGVAAAVAVACAVVAIYA